MFFVECTPQSKHRHALFQPLNSNFSQRRLGHPLIETAMKNGACSILLLHNHPNGNPEASEQDITITKAIDIPARVLNITIYDHIIVAGEKYFSFKEHKII
jgi:DNA repair protein RadC